MIRYTDASLADREPADWRALRDRLDDIFAGDWRARREELAGLTFALARDDLALRQLVTSHCADGTWPPMAGAPSFDLRRTPTYRVRLNVWYPPTRFEAAREEHANYHSVGQCHNHAFDFFTACVFGPGYESRFLRLETPETRLEQDADAELTDLGTLTLHPGEVWYVERDRDFHTQQWPSAYAITLNLIPRPGPDESQRQYLIDEAERRVLKVVDGRA